MMKTDVVGFKLIGRQDFSDIIIEHSDWPGVSWRLMIPEYGWVGASKRAQNVEWIEREGSVVSWRWADEEAKKEAGNDFWGSARVLSTEEIEYSLTFKNLGGEVWRERQSSLICLISGNVSAFLDYEGHRIFVYECNLKRFIDIDTLIDGNWPDHRMCGAKVATLAGQGNRAVERLMVKVSKDGRHVLAIATDPAVGVSCNHQEKMSCIHSNPLWGPVPPAGIRTVRGKIYLFQGTKEDALERYRLDFGMLS